METQNPPNSQSDLQKEKMEQEESGSLISDGTKSYSNKDNMVLAQKLEIQISKTGKKLQK